MDMTTRTGLSGVGKALGVGSLALLTAALLLLAGCAQAGTGSGGGSPANGSATSAPPTGANVTPTIPLPPEPSLGIPTQGPDQVDASGCHRNLVLTETAHATYCVNLGGTVTLTLNGTADQRWQPVKLGGTALTDVPMSGIPPIGPSITTLYKAVQTGTATLTSARPLCPPAKPGSASCLGMQAFQVTITVR
jgi:hypothetical protein